VDNEVAAQSKKPFASERLSVFKKHPFHAKLSDLSHISYIDYTLEDYSPSIYNL
jgi:hypothetical protein